MEYTSDQLHFFRLSYIVFDIVPEVLRKIFKQEWDALYKGTPGQWDDTPTSYTAFYNMESAKNQARNKRLLELMSSGDRNNWDCTCLFYAILYSDSVGPTLTSVVSNGVDEIREIRNEMAHNKTGKMSEAEFQKSIKKIKLAFSCLKVDITRIEEIKNQTCFPTEDLSRIQKELQNVEKELQVEKKRKENAEKELEDEKKRNAEPNSFCILPPHPSHDTIYRKKEVDSICESMQRLSSENQGETTVVYLSGNPGCGKSVMAKHIGEKCYDRDDTTETLKFVMTLDASTLDTLLNSYMMFAQKLNCYPDSITSITTSKDLSKEEQILQLRFLVDKQVAKYSKWLVIADNVTDLKLFSKYWPQGGEKTGGEGQTLVTTQDSSSIGVSLSSHYHHVSMRSGMIEEDALELLSKVSGYTDGEHSLIVKVCKALDFQPLALSCTAVYVRSVRTINEQYTWLQCLTDLESEREKLETVYKKTSLAYKATMTAAVNLGIQREISEEVMLHAFRFLSLIASDPIPLKYVVEYVVKCMPDEDKNGVAVRICSSSMVCSSFVQETKEISMHQVVYHCLQKHEKLRESTVDMFTVISAFSEIPIINDECPVDGLTVTKPLVNHFLNVSKKLIDYVVTKESTSERVLEDHLCSVLNRLASVLSEHVSLESAKDFLQVVLALEMSRSILSKAKEVLIVLMGTNHVEYISNININGISPSVGIAMNNLGNAYQKLGRLEESITYYEKALAIKTAVYGGNHPSVGDTMNNLGNAYQELGRLEESITYYEKALAIKTAVYGENHPSVGDTMNNLGNAYQELGRLEESITYYEKNLAIKTAVYGENHPSVGIAMNNLGNTYQKLGRLEESITYYEKNLAIKTAVYGENHPSVGIAMNNFGNAYQELGRLEESITYYEKALAIKTAVYGGNHSSVGHTMNNLGNTYQKLGRLEESITYYEKALAIKTAVYGGNHPSVGDTMNNLGNAYGKLGRLEESITYYEKALAIKTAVYGGNHQSVSITMNNLGNAYGKLGRLEESITYYEKALAIKTAVYGGNHPSVGNTMNNLGITYRKLRRFDDARRSYEQALIIYRSLYDDDHPSISRTEKNLSILLSATKCETDKSVS